MYTGEEEILLKITILILNKFIFWFHGKDKNLDLPSFSPFTILLPSDPDAGPAVLLW